MEMDTVAVTVTATTQHTINPGVGSDELWSNIDTVTVMGFISSDATGQVVAPTTK